MKKAFTIILILLLPFAAQAAKWQEITPKQVYDLMSEGSGLWMIDVRGPQSFEEVHIEGSVNISPTALAVKNFPEKKILVVADNALGQLQAKEVADSLVKNGQKRVYVLSGGIAAWEQAKLPIVGDGLNWPLRQVMPQELLKAKKQKVNVELYDLRDENDYVANPLEDTKIIPGEKLDGRLHKLLKLVELQQKKNLAAKLKNKPVTVVVLPAAANAKEIYQQYLWMLSEDIRIMDGAYLAARSGEKQRLSSGDGCRTCPGG